MSTKLRILFLTHGTPFPVRSGGHMYTANVIRTLAERVDIELTVLALGRASSIRDTPSGVTWHIFPPPRGGGTFRGLVGKYPRSTGATMSRGYKRKVHALLGGTLWDAIVIDYIAIGWVLPAVIRLTKARQTRVVYISHNVESTLRMRIAEGYNGPAPLRWLALRDGRKAARLEAEIVRSATLLTAETEDDASEFRSLYRPRKIHIYTPGYDGEVISARNIRLADARRAVAVIGSRIATMKRLVLDEILESIAPRLDEYGVAMIVAGEAPHEYITSRAETYSFVEFHGYVADIAPLLASLRLGLITDHIGGGFKHRILTLVFNRVPIIATRQAMAGLPMKPGVHYIEVAGNDEAPDVIHDVIDDVALLDAIQSAAFGVCERAFDWKVTTDGFVRALGATPVEGR